LGADVLWQSCSFATRRVTPTAVAESVRLTTTKSSEIFSEAKTLMPGGVSSPVRAFKSVGGEPIVFDKVKGAYCYDVDGEFGGERMR